jgi:hypothetical protein
MTGTTEAAIVDGINVDVVAAAVRACPGVSDLSGGRFGDVTSYLPGRRVPGVSVESATVTVQIRARWGVPATDLLAQIRAAITPLVNGRSVRVVVDDIDDPHAPAALPPAAVEDRSTAEPIPGASTPVIEVNASQPAPF